MTEYSLILITYVSKIMSHTGVLENVVTTLVGTKQQAYQEHAWDTREVMHMSISNLFPQEGIRMHCKVEVQQRYDMVWYMIWYEKITIYTQTKKGVQQKFAVE